jgi:hypothetical protein
LSGPAAELYRASAELFVAELLRFRDGPACLTTMLGRLPRYYNWQLAFLDGFRGHFDRALDIEKWWALGTVSSPEQEAAPKLSMGLSWDDLNHAFLTTTAGTAAGIGPSGGASATLQTIIRDWPRVQQRQALSSKIQELSLLRARLSPELALLVQEYCQAVDIYLRNPPRSGPLTLFGAKPGLSSEAKDTLQRLDALDARRAALRPPQTALSASELTAPPALRP